MAENINTRVIVLIAIQKRLSKLRFTLRQNTIINVSNFLKEVCLGMRELVQWREKCIVDSYLIGYSKLNRTSSIETGHNNLLCYLFMLLFTQ